MLSFILVSLIQAAPTLEYGEVYFKETTDREAPLLHLSTGYGLGISNSYLDLNSIVATAQVRVWKYFSTGLFGQIISSQYSDAGAAIDSLSQVDILAEVPTPLWGMFSLSYLQLMVGKWNVLNLFPLEVDLLVGGGCGTLKRQGSINSAAYSYFSYLWSVEQRMQLLEKDRSSLGLLISFFGHREGVFMQSGLSYNFK